MSLGESIRVLRCRNGLKLTEFAKVVGVTKQAVSGFERSERGTNEATLKRYARSLGYTPFLVINGQACDPKVAWGDHLRRCRNELDMSALEVATNGGFTTNTVYDAEASESICELTVYGLCDAMGVAVDFGFKKGNEIVFASSLAVARKLSAEKLQLFLINNGWRVEPERGPDDVVYQVGDEDAGGIFRVVIPTNRGRPSYGTRMREAVRTVAFAMKIDPDEVRRAAQD